MLIRTLTMEQKQNWCRWLPAVQAAINGNYHSGLGDSPDFVLLGRDKRHPSDLLHKDKLLPNYTGSIPEEIYRSMQKIWRAAKKALIDTKARAIRISAKTPTPKPISPGSLVFHLIEYPGNIRQKLNNKWEGPFRVIRTRTNQALCENMQSKHQSWFHVDKLKRADGLYEADEYDA